MNEVISRRDRELAKRSALPVVAGDVGTIDGQRLLPGILAWGLDVPVGAKTAIALLGCALLATMLAFYQLGARGIFSPAEARYALIAREMIESGDWIQPRFNHVRYDEKPPLLYWAIAASYRWLGPGDFASRVPSALAFVGTAALTFAIAYELAGATVAPLAALVYTTSVGTFLFGRFVFTDTLLVFSTTLSLYGLARISRQRAGPGPAIAFYLGMALAGLTKGLIGLLFPVVTAIAYGLLFAERGYWRRMRPAIGLAVLAGVFLPWHVAMALRDPAFVDFYIVNEHVRRFLGTREPIDYVSLSVVGFWLATLFWLLPWTLFLPGALASALKRDARQLAIPLLWSTSIVGFFTLTDSRLEYYALPSVPGLAVIMAVYWRHFFHRRVRRWEIQLPAIVLLAAALVALPKIFLFPQGGFDLLTAMVSNVDGYYREYFIRHPDESFALVNESLRLARPFSILLCLIGGGTALLVSGGRRRLAFTLLVASTIPCLGFVDFGMRLVTTDRSQRAFAQVIERYWTDDSRLVVAGDFEDLCGIAYYTRRPTQMLDPDPQDLLFGFRRGDAPDLFLSTDDFRSEWHSEKLVFVLSSKSFDLPDGTVLAESPRDVLRVNHAIPGAVAPDRQSRQDRLARFSPR
ncbi:MAG TPA: glycosyltransferase family 39 protein [Candidatus Binatia bacterium]|nr:glycosyltransferase family 39 protein [Candidatus Binatia bacterium]